MGNPRKSIRFTDKRRWKSVRYIVLARDLFQCQHCGFIPRRLKNMDQQGNYLTIDHIRPVSVGGCDNVANLQTLCVACHSIKDQGHPPRVLTPYVGRWNPETRTALGQYPRESI